VKEGGESLPPLEEEGRSEERETGPPGKRGFFALGEGKRIETEVCLIFPFKERESLLSPCEGDSTSSGPIEEERFFSRGEGGPLPCWGT